MRRVTLVCTLLLPLLVAGCGDDDPPETPTAPTIPTVTDTFTGTLTRNGATSHPFLVTSIVGGSVTATLKTVTPNVETVVGITLGTWNGSSCQAVISNDRATAPTTLLGLATSTTTLCVRIYDIGTVEDPQDYEFEVVHP
jgi:hypothetical protein